MKTNDVVKSSGQACMNSFDWTNLGNWIFDTDGNLVHYDEFGNRYMIIVQNGALGISAFGVGTALLAGKPYKEIRDCAEMLYACYFSFKKLYIDGYTWLEAVSYARHSFFEIAAGMTLSDDDCDEVWDASDDQPNQVDLWKWLLTYMDRRVSYGYYDHFYDNDDMPDEPIAVVKYEDFYEWFAGCPESSLKNKVRDEMLPCIARKEWTVPNPFLRGDQTTTEKEQTYPEFLVDYFHEHGLDFVANLPFKDQDELFSILDEQPVQTLDAHLREHPGEMCSYPNRDFHQILFVKDSRTDQWVEEQLECDLLRSTAANSDTIEEKVRYHEEIKHVHEVCDAVRKWTDLLGYCPISD